MRIALIFFELTSGGGVLQFIRLAHELTTKGHDVQLFCYQNRASQELLKLVKDIPLHTVLKRDEPISTSPFSLKPKLEDLASLVESQGSFDILNPHEWPAQLAAALVKRKTKTPVVWMCNDLWHVPQEEWLSSTYYTSSQYYRQPTVIEQFFSFWWMKRKLRWWLDRYLTRSINKIVVLDTRIQQLIDLYYGRKARIVRTGFDKERFEKVLGQSVARKQVKLPEKGFVFLLFGVLYPHRRFEDVVAAGAKLLEDPEVPDDFSIVIVGDASYDPTYTDTLKHIIEKTGMKDHVVLRTQFVPFGKQFAFFSACDTFIFPNERQTWGITPIEVMSLGRACIISRGAGVHEVIKDGDTALLFNPRDVNELAAQMKKLLLDKPLRKTIAMHARAFVRQHFSWGKYATEMEEIFEKTISK